MRRSRAIYFFAFAAGFLQSAQILKAEAAFNSWALQPAKSSAVEGCELFDGVRPRPSRNAEAVIGGMPSQTGRALKRQSLHNENTVIRSPREPVCCQANEFLQEQWGGEKKDMAAAIPLYFSRLLADSIMSILAGQTASRAANSVDAIGSAAQGNSQRVAVLYADSLANIPGLLADMTSDAGSMVKQFMYASAPASSRIQLCTANTIRPENNPTCALVRSLNPLVHIGVLIDGGRGRGGYETRDPPQDGIFEAALKAGGDVRCRTVPLMSGESESLAIERLECVDRIYHEEAPYDFLKYNCGGYTKDILEWSGLGYSLFANLGIGSDISSKDLKQMESSRQKIAAKCGSRISAIRNAIATLEGGRALDGPTLNFLKNPTMPFSPDVIVQLIISAARGRNSANRLFIAGLNFGARGAYTEGFRVYYDDPTGTPLGKVGDNVKPLLTGMFQGLDAEALDWIRQAAPRALDLQYNLKK